MTVEDEKFFAWLDGELPPDEAAEVERQVDADPDLRRLAEEHRALGAGLRQAFDPVLDAAVPDRIQAAAAPAQANLVDFAARRRQSARPLATPARQWAALAATLVLGIVVGTTFDSSGASSPAQVRGGQLYAAGTIDRALEGQLASAGAAGDVRIGLTFRDETGAICRTFEGNAATGVACRDDGDWRLRGLFSAPDAAETEYRMAAGTDPRLMELVDSMIAGEPFDASRERQAKERGWE